MTMSDDPYAVLRLDPSASAEDLRRAYFRLVRQYTPEAHPEEFKRIRAAYEALRSPLRRAELALLTFDESAAEVDLDLVAAIDRAADVDAAALLLAVEESASDLDRVDFAADQTPIDEEGLLADAPPS